MKQYEYKAEKVFIDKEFEEFDEIKFLNTQGDLGWSLASIDILNVSKLKGTCFQYLFVREKV